MRVSEPNDLSVGEPQRPDIHRVTLAVLRYFGPDHAISPAAIVGRVIIKTLQRNSELANRRRNIIAHPMHDGFGQSAAKDCGRGHRDASLVGQYHGFELNDVIHAALALGKDWRQRWRNGKCRSEAHAAS